MKYIWLLTVLMVGVLLGCGGGPDFISERNVYQHNYVIVQADTLYSLTMPALYDKFVHSELLPRGGIVPKEQVEEFVDSLVCDTLAGLDARNVKLDEYYEYFKLYRRRYYSFLVKRYLQETVYKKVSVDSQEVVEFYQSRPDLFGVSEQVLLHQILISPIGLKNGPDSLYYRSLSPEELEKETEKYAWQVKRLLDLGQPFAEVARKYSHDVNSAKEGGFIGWTGRGVYLDPFDSVAFSMKPGEISEPYHDRSGWHILYIENHLDEGIPPMNEELYNVAETSLVQLKANTLGFELEDSLVNLIQLEYNEKLLDTNIYFVDKSQWVAIVNGQDTIDAFDLQGLEESYRRRYRVSNTTPEIKKEMLRQIAEHYIFVQAARATGIDTLPDVRKQEAYLRHKYAKEIVLKRAKDPSWMPPDSLIKKYYNEHKDEFTVEKPLTIQHIIVQDSVLGEFIRDQALAGVDFIELAKQYYPGEPSVRADLANLGEIGPDDVPEELYKAALATPIQGVSHPVKTKYGYHVIKVLKREETKSVDRVRYKIVPILKKQHERELFEAFRDDLYKRYHVRFLRKLYPVHLKPLDSRI